MITNKLFDCVFITIDKQDRKTVRVANDFDKRMRVLKRDMKSILFQHDFESAKTLDEIVDFLTNSNAVDVDDEEVVDVFRTKLKLSKMKQSKTSANDVLAAIKQRPIISDVAV